MTARRCLAIALAVGLLHSLIAGAIAAFPWSYGTVGAERMFDDVHVYYTYATRTVQGEEPYRDFPVEYPVLALPFFVAPRLLAPDFDRYRVLFALEMLTANAFAIGLIAWWSGRNGSSHVVGGRLAWLTLAFAVLCPLALCRFDLLAMSWTFAAAVAWHSQRPLLGGVLAGSGILVKLVPGVVAVPGLMSPRTGRLMGLGGLVASTALGAALWFIVGGHQVFRSFGYHLERGVEIGSVFGGALMAAAVALGAPLETVYRHKSLEVVTPWSNLLGSFGFPVQAIALLLVAFRARQAEGREPLRFTAAAVLAFVAFGKVLSPQYLLWVLPFVACLNGRMGVWSRSVFLLACLVTTLLYPVAFHWLLDFRGWAVGLLNYRNALLVALWVYWTFAPIEEARRTAGASHILESRLRTRESVLS
jgi:hypothetical protein